MKLVYYPDESLLVKTNPVTTFDDELHKELDNMQGVMLKHNGLGLSANQVGLSKSMFIAKIKTSLYEDPTIVEFINPTLKSIDTEMQYLQEGCLSAPQVFLKVARPLNVLITAQDRKGEEFTLALYAYEAVCVMHEYEHLQGIFYFDKVNRQERRCALKELDKNKKKLK